MNAGADRMDGGLDDYTYVVDDPDDVVSERANESIDTVLAFIFFTRKSNVENPVLMGTANLSGGGNDQGNRIAGNAGANRPPRAGTLLWRVGSVSPARTSDPVPKACK